MYILALMVLNLYELKTPELNSERGEIHEWATLYTQPFQFFATTLSIISTPP